MAKRTLKKKIHALYKGESRRADRFRYGLLMADLVMVVFLVASSFFYKHPVVQVLNVVFGVYLLVDYMARLWLAEKKIRYLLNPINLADAVAIVSFIAPLLGLDFGFLRVLRIVRLMRSYRLLARLRADFTFFQKNEDIVNSTLNLFIFIFIMTEIVLVTQRGTPGVDNFLDAMYFTITALTTTGFGDITLQGDRGRLVSIVVMIFGVSLFLRLIQTILRPSKVRFVCTECGLYLHEADAVHCKHCGDVLNIPSDGAP